MKFKLSFLFLLTIFISLQSPKQINAQNSYECAWEERNGVSSCIISEHQVTCEEGFYAGDACDNILNKEECLDAKWACNQIEPDQNRHTCVYTDTLGCRPTNTCVYGYTPSNACEGLNKDECLNVSPQSCVLKTKPIIRAKEKLICITNEGTEGINSAIGCISISNENENLIFLLTWAGGILGGVGIILIIYGGFLIMSSQGDRNKAALGKEVIFSAVMGIVFIIISAFLLRTLGADILNLPDF